MGSQPRESSSCSWKAASPVRRLPAEVRDVPRTSHLERKRGRDAFEAEQISTGRARSRQRLRVVRLMRVEQWQVDVAGRMPPSIDAFVECSTPVLSFGDPLTAEVATIGINPSRREFNDGGWLRGQKR